MEIKAVKQKRIFFYNQIERSDDIYNPQDCVARRAIINFVKENRITKWQFDEAKVELVDNKWSREDWKFFSEVHQLIEKHLSTLLSEDGEQNKALSRNKD